MMAAPFTGEIPAASSGASNSLSAASAASLRTAVIRTLMLTDPSPRASRATRQAVTVALVKPGRGSCSYQVKMRRGHVVDPFRNRGRYAIQHESLQSLPLGSLRNNNHISDFRSWTEAD
jgi:hypothetical protein